MPARPRVPRRPGLLLAVPLLALSGIAAGCGGSAKTSTSSTTTPAGANGTAAASRAKFTSCLEAHGVPASEATRGFGFRRPSGSSGSSTSSSTPSTPPTSRTPPSTSAAFAAAFQACRADLPARSGIGGFQNTTAGRAYLQCLQLHGVTLPSTPPTSAGTGTGGAGTGTGGSDFRSLTTSPAYQAARTACAALAPTRSGAPGGSTSTSSTTAAG